MTAIIAWRHIDLTFEIPFRNRLIIVGYLLFATWGIALFAILLFLQEFLLRGWRPPARFSLSAFLALPIAAIVGWVHNSRWNYRLTISDSIEITRHQLTVSLCPDDVVGIVGVGGLNLDGRKFFAWKHVLIVTDQDVHRLSLGYESSESCCEGLRRVSTNAWTIPFRGEISPPAFAETNSTSSHLSSLKRVKNVIRSVVKRSAVLGLTILLGSAAFLTGLFLNTEPEEIDGRALAGLKVVFAAGPLFLIDTVQEMRTLVSIRRLERELERSP